jgi:hypothetical protein
MNRDQNQNNPDNKATNPNPPTSLNRIAAELEKLNSHTQKQASDEEKENKLWNWRNGKKHILFIVQVITLFGTVVALVFTCNSVNMSRKALVAADTANDIAKRSLDSNMNFNRESMEYQRSKDVSNDSVTNNTLKIAQQNADAATNLANQSIQSLKDVQKRFEIENEPYVRFIPFVNFRDSMPKFTYKIINYGKMPAILKGHYTRIIVALPPTSQSKIDSAIIDTLKLKIQYSKYVREVNQLMVNGDSENEMNYPYIINWTEFDKIKFVHGEYVIYWYGRLKYEVKTGSNKQFEYRYIVMMNLAPNLDNTLRIEYDYLFADTKQISKN